jgi:hypothetical protein
MESDPLVRAAPAADFRRFIETPWPDGCETPLVVLERALRGTKAWEAFLELTRGERGANPGDVRNPEGLGGPNGKMRDEVINRDNVTVNHNGDDSATTLPISPPPAKPKRDYSREAPTGNSVSYAMRRLKKHAPELAAKVMAGETSANAAAVAAGFRERKVTIPYNPARAARILLRHLGPDAVRALIAGLSSAVGHSPDVHGSGPPGLERRKSIIPVSLGCPAYFARRSWSVTGLPSARVGKSSGSGSTHSER